MLTAARLDEVRGAKWREINLETRVWTVPIPAMKGRREHEVPLSDAAIAILTTVQPPEGADPPSLIFPNIWGGQFGTASILRVTRRPPRHLAAAV
jgi:integrase